jgi:hypothetical protein
MIPRCSFEESFMATNTVPDFDAMDAEMSQLSCSPWLDDMLIERFCALLQEEEFEDVLQEYIVPRKPGQ